MISGCVRTQRTRAQAARTIGRSYPHGRGPRRSRGGAAPDTRPVTTDPRITAFSFRRQRLDGSATSALDAVASVVGVYSANPSGPLSIHVRAPSASREDVLALDADRLVERMRAMRTSAFVVPRATAPLIRAATFVPVERFAWLHARPAPGRGVVRPRSRRASSRLPPTPGPRRSSARRWTSTGGRSGPLMSLLAIHGDIVSVGSGSLTSNASRYQSRSAWLADSASPRIPIPPRREPGSRASTCGPSGRRGSPTSPGGRG